MTRAARGVALFALVAVLMMPESAAETPQEILERVRKKFETVKDAELTFSQRTRFALSKLEQNASGTLSMKKEHKYRIETEEQTIVTDGATVWSYSVPNKQVLIDVFKMNERAMSPERILAGAPGDFTASVVGREKLGRFETVVLKLVPVAEQSLASAIRLWVDTSEALIRKAEVSDVNGKETTYTVGAYKLNTGMSDTRFTFSIPDGVEAVDLR